MMSPLSAGLDTAVNATASVASGAAATTADGTEGQPFSALIQGLKPAGASVSVNAPDAAIAQPVVAATESVLPDNTDPLASALDSVLQALGMSETVPETGLSGQHEIDTSTTDTGNATDAESLAVPLTILPTVPVLVPNAPVISGSASALPGAANAGTADAMIDAAFGSPAQRQARQWFAAQAPALSAGASDGSSNSAAAGGVVKGDALPMLTQQTAALTAAAAQVVPAASTMPSSGAWLQQPIASFFNMSAASDATAVSSDLMGLSPDSSPLSLEAPKGMPSAMNFAQTLTSSSTSTTAPVLTTLLPHAVQDPAWADAFGQRVAMLAQQGTQSATLQMNPPELGPIQVRIAMGEQGARVEFNTSQQTTSDLIETAMPRLAAALEHQGLRLDDSRVNLVASRQDVFTGSSAFSAARQDTPQGDRGQAAQQQGQAASRQSGTSNEQDSGQRQSNVIRLPVAAKSGIDYYA